MRYKLQKKNTLNVFFMVAMTFLFTSPAFGVPYELQYSGRITAVDGSPIGGSIDIEVKFFRSPSGTDEVTVTMPQFPGVTLNEGVFNLTISLSPADFHKVFSEEDPVWIQVKDVTHNQSYPRQKFSTVPFALKVPVDNTSITYSSDGTLQVGQVSPTSLTSENGTSGQILTSDGSGGMNWQTATGVYPQQDATKVGFLSVTGAVNLDSLKTDVSTLKTDVPGKQPAGNYITTITGDVTASGPSGGGSAAATIAAGAVTLSKISGVGCSDKDVLQRSGANWICGAMAAGNLTGVAAVENGGTGQTSLNSGGILLGNGTSGVSSAGPGTTGQIPINNGTTIAMASVSGDATLDSSGGLTISNNVVTSAKIGAAQISNSHINGTAAIAVNKLAAGVDGQVLTMDGTTPAWKTPTTMLSALNLGTIDGSDNSWQTGPAGPGNAAFTGGVLLPSGKVFAIPFYYTGTNTIYNPATNAWETGPAGTGEGGAYMGGVLLPNGKVFAFPGMHSGTNTIYNPTTNAWETGPPSPVSGAFAGGVLLPNGKVFAIPFYYTGTNTIYNPSTNAWEEGPAGPGGQAFIGGVLLPNGKVFAIPFSYTGTNTVYNPTTNAWETGPAGPGGQAFIGGVLLPNGKVFAIPYCYSGTSTIYNPTTNAWEEGPAARTGFYGGVLLPNGKVFAIPTFNTSANTIYNPVTNSWEEGPVGPGSFAFRGGVLLPNGKVFAIPFNYTGTNTIYNPSFTTESAEPWCWHPAFNKL